MPFHEAASPAHGLWGNLGFLEAKTAPVDGQCRLAGLGDSEPGCCFVSSPVQFRWSWLGATERDLQPASIWVRDPGCARCGGLAWG